MQTYNFYSVVIGTELMNGRREDKHFNFINKALRDRGFKHFANFMIVDDVILMERVFEMIKNDPHSIMFCFGGIGSTPDDYTREIAAKVFTNNQSQTHPEALRLILETFQDEAYPHRVKMANLPLGASLLDNVVNKVPGFSLEERFFFAPGFPSMAWPMFSNILTTKFKPQQQHYACSFFVEASENDLIDIMEALPHDIELSSLPKIENNKKSVEIYLASKEQDYLHTWCQFFQNEMKKLNITFRHLKTI
ncbi:competence/damage-inducible protein A [Sulfurospirillum sp. 1612]|uniref:competence/damage-inducible protein A n=1 Tax=Sulfurospirillum sp. 1612 TaxID=3094835 RepID=UPI002F93F21A